MSRESIPSPIDPQPSSATQDCHAPPLPVTRSNRPSRACTVRTAARLHAVSHQYQHDSTERRPKPKKEQLQHEEISDESLQQCSGSSSKIVTSLVGPPETSQLTQWSLRSMWELASVLNFFNVFRPLLNITFEFSAEEFETALITSSDALSDIHIPLLKAIPPVTRMALTRNTWITVLCRKLRDWWHWVADGDLPIVTSQGAEIDVYKTLDPAVRVVILKALCDIRVEQEDVRNYIDNSLKHGVQLSAFRKERTGGDSHGINYWYEDDPVIGHRLYREIRKSEVKKLKSKGSQTFPSTTYQWETVATNLDEFEDVSEKLFQSQNRTEASLGKKLKNDMLPEIEKVHKRREKLLKKQHRQALLLDNFLNIDGLGPGRSLRDRKPVTYTFDDYDRSINEAIKITKQKPPSPEPMPRQEASAKPEATSNGKWTDPLQDAQFSTFSSPSPNSPDYNEDELDGDHKPDMLDLDRSNRRRQRPQRYSAKEFVGVASDNDVDFDTDDEIVGEAVYDDEYLKKHKRRKLSSSSEGDEEYCGDEENAEDEYEEEEEEEEEGDSSSASEESDDQPEKLKKNSRHSSRRINLRSLDDRRSGLRRSKRATKNRINYRQMEQSESDTESVKLGNASDNAEFSQGSRDTDNHEMKVDEPETLVVAKEETQAPEKLYSPAPGEDEEVEGVQKRRFLDLNELAPGSGFDDGPNTIIPKDGNRDDL